MNAKARSCDTCRYYVRLSSVSGECHCNPPAIGGRGEGRWPGVLFEDWCGEWDTPIPPIVEPAR